MRFKLVRPKQFQCREIESVNDIAWMPSHWPIFSGIMAMIHATVDGSYKEQRGDKRVLVGILDTGVDGSHPDIAPNFSRRLSRNFTVDVPLVDGECADDPDGSCEDPADVDENGHGTHVAGTIGAALNGLGIGGIAPNVTLVNLRAGQDSGYFFLQASVDALTYAGDIGVDVVNMSYYIDPWLFNCANNPADSPEAQLEQRTIIEATNRALKYAHKHGVTLIAAAGNEHTDLGNPTVDRHQPRLPAWRRVHAHDQQLLPGAADRGQVCDQRHGDRAERSQGRLLELWRRAGRRVGARRLLPRLLWHAAAPGERESDPVGVPEVGRAC